MLLTEIELYNFRQFQGKQVVKLASGDNNVTVLIGVNTSGKTTFVQAFRWVLYGDSNFTGKGRTSILSEGIRSGLEKGQTTESYVTLKLTHNNIEYEITRRIEYIGRGAGEVVPTKSETGVLEIFYYNSMGERREYARKEGEGLNDKIEEILPNELSDYFFFDGEKISDSTKRKNVKNSIYSVMGLTPLLHLIQHLTAGTENVMARYRQELIPVNNEELNRYNREIARLSREMLNLDEEIKNSADRIIPLLEKDYENALKAFQSIEAMREKAIQLKSVDSSITQHEKELILKRDKVITSFGAMITELYYDYIANELYHKIRDVDYDDKDIPGVDATTIQFLINRGECICGEPLTETHLEHLRELLKFVPPESVGNQLSRLKKALQLEQAHTSDKLFESYYDAFNELSTTLSEENETKTRLLKELGGATDADKITDTYRRAESKLSNEKKKLEANKLLKNQKEREKEDYEKKIRDGTAIDEKNQDVKIKMEYVDQLQMHANYCLNQESEKIINDIREGLTTNFNNMYHGKRSIELTDNYEVNLSVRGSKLDTSKGLETVANFAFIATLLKVARDRALSQSELKSEPYPLVMDALFSNTDQTHIENICAYLPSLAEQAVLALMDKDWRYAKNKLGSKVGRMYRIVKVNNSDTQSIIQEESN